jgi:hypothetical protein
MSCAAWTAFSFVTLRMRWANDHIVHGMEFLAVFFLFLAPILAWWEENKKVESLERQIASNHPDLHPQFHMDATGHSDRNYIYFVWIQIRNSGGTSIATLENMKAIDPTGKHLKLRISHPRLSDLKIPHGPGEEIVLKADENFSHLFFKKAIEKGTAPVGWIEVFFEEEPIPDGTTFSADISDVEGKRTPLRWIFAQNRIKQPERALPKSTSAPSV